jgi:hypothetical protein
MNAVSIILSMIGELAKVVADIIGGREDEPVWRVEEVWNLNRSSLIKAQYDEVARKALEKT